jgi:hypothetical protein
LTQTQKIQLDYFIKRHTNKWDFKEMCFHPEVDSKLVCFTIILRVCNI